MNIIYRIENTQNDKLYIGKTNKSAEVRLQQHFYESQNDNRNHSYLHKAIRKYGEDNFKITIIEEVGDDWKNREKFWISHYDTFTGVGYNLTPGGEGTQMFGEQNPMYGKTGELCPSYGLVRSDETKSKQSESRLNYLKDNPIESGENHPLYGFTASDSTKKLMRDAWKSREYTTCPHCGLESQNVGNMNRWHNDNCKHNPLSPRFRG